MRDMIEYSESIPRTEYRPAALMKVFAKKLEIFVRGRDIVSDSEFRIQLYQAFEHARAMFMGGGNRLFQGVAKACGVRPATVRDWMNGKIPPPEGAGIVILRRLHAYLSARYC